MNLERVLLVGGRSGGHLYALVALARELQARRPDVALRFVGEQGRMEEELVPREGYELSVLDMPPTVAGWRRPLQFGRWLGLYRQSVRLLAEFRPQAVVGSGGQVCLPVLLAAHRAGLPTILLEPNSIPGWANRVIARLARPDLVGVLIPAAAKFLPPGQAVATLGYPLRPAVLTATREESARALGLDPAKRTLLVFGGSQGSGHVNDVLVELLPQLTAPWAHDLQILHLGGWLNARGADPAALAGLPFTYVYQPYLHEMEWALAAADLVVGRAGATSMAELTARGLPAVLVPLEGLADNHQVYNADWMSEPGAAVVLADKDLTPASLAAVLGDLLGTPGKLAAMADASRALGRPDAATLVVERLGALVESRR